MTQEELKEVIRVYYANNNEEKDYKKLVSRDNEIIKKAMAEMKIDTFEANGLTASVSTSVRESFDEDKLVKTLQRMGLNGLLVMKPTVDMDKLEEAIYSGKISDAQLLEIGSCKESKEVVTLRVNRTKKKKEEDE